MAVTAAVPQSQLSLCSDDCLGEPNLGLIYDNKIDYLDNFPYGVVVITCKLTVCLKLALLLLITINKTISNPTSRTIHI